MAFISKEKLDVLQAKSDNFDSVVAAIVAADSEIKTEDVTPEMLADKNNDASAAQIAEMQTKNDSLEQKVTALESEKQVLLDSQRDLQAKLAQRPSTAAANPQGVSSANNVQTDTLAILDTFDHNKEADKLLK
ncbi:MAG: hypothetical protein FWD66_06905 [Paludibacter sp.]|nr:hypothetical protein [Paludibacter sp.]